MKNKESNTLSRMFLSGEVFSCTSASAVRLEREKQRIQEADLFDSVFLTLLSVKIGHQMSAHDKIILLSILILP